MSTRISNNNNTIMHRLHVKRVHPNYKLPGFTYFVGIVAGVYIGSRSMTVRYYITLLCKSSFR
jgi:hypothetical protein